ncbi:hypothetical protein WJX82_001897 [Trebouxia sp. C0006]
MEEKRQLTIAWKAKATAPDLVASCSNPNFLPPFIQQRKSRPGLYVLYKVNRRGQTPEVVFYKSFQDGTFEQQLKAAKSCLYEQIQNGVIKPSTAARRKLGLPVPPEGDDEEQAAVAYTSTTLQDQHVSEAGQQWEGIIKRFLTVSKSSSLPSPALLEAQPPLKRRQSLRDAARAKGRAGSPEVSSSNQSGTSASGSAGSLGVQDFMNPDILKTVKLWRFQKLSRGLYLCW